MRFLLVSIVAIYAFTFIGCCFKKHRVEPEYPKNVVGWNEYEKVGVKMLGNFVLKIGEATDNGRVRLKVVELIPGNPCDELEMRSSSPRVTLQFIRVSDGQIICSGAFAENEGGLLTSECKNSLKEYGIYAYGIRAINLKEGWVFIELIE